MKSTGEGARGGSRRCMCVSSSEPVALAKVARRAGRDDVLPHRVAPPRARHDVVEREPSALSPQYDAAPAVAGEERPARDAALHGARHADVRRRAGSRAAGCRCSSPCAAARRAVPPPRPCPSRRARARDVSAHVERLIARVQDEHMLTCANVAAAQPGSGPRIAPTWPSRVRRPRAPRGRGRGSARRARAP